MHSTSKNLFSRLIVCLLLTLGHSGLLAAPIISNVSFLQRIGTKLVDVSYDIAASGPNTTVKLEVSSNGGVTWAVPVTTVSGAVGAGITDGTGKLITWDAGVDWNGQISSQMKMRVTAWDLLGPNDVAYSFIPGGSYQRGDNLDSMSDAPVQMVVLSEYFMQKTETTKAQYDLVLTWARTHGYNDIAEGLGKASNHPIQNINWYDAAKWCNAASEMEGLTPCYYTDDAQTTVYRTGSTDMTNMQVKWDVNGYRLPTEAEWEVAARGGLSGKRFPWGDTIQNGPASSGGQANYNADSSVAFPYDLGPTGFNSAYITGGMPYTSPVGSFMANGYGLYDMAGNSHEWCWDWYSSNGYESSINPRGPINFMIGTTRRVLRGGGWRTLSGRDTRCALRTTDAPQDKIGGFRPVRGRVEGTNGIASATASVNTLSPPNTTTIPTVTTPTAASVTGTQATLGGNVTVDGNSIITERGVVYSATATNSDPLIGGTGVVKVTNTGTLGVFNVAVTGLTQGNGYSFKAYATNSQGTSYSSLSTFTTPPDSPFPLSIPIRPTTFPLNRPTKIGTPIIWGDNSKRQRNIPSNATDIVQVAVGGQRVVALKNDGTLIGWGSISVPRHWSNIAQVSVGKLDGYLVALTIHGDVLEQGQGVPAFDGKPDNLNNVVQISVGYEIVAALRSNGTVVVWGRNEFGECNVPPGLDNVVQVAAGNGAVAALRSDGSVVVWGSSHYGLVTTASSISDAVAIAGGGMHFLVLKKDGTVFAWGHNDVGQTNVPNGLEQIISVSAGYDEGVALSANGIVSVWGYGYKGEKDVPLQMNRAIQISGGGGGNMAALISESVLPFLKPPTSLIATPGDRQVSIAFTPGAYGDSAITNYEFSTDNGTNWTLFNPLSTASPVVISGLTNGTTYSIRLRAINAYGPGAASAAITSTPAIPAEISVEQPAGTGLISGSSIHDFGRVIMNQRSLLTYTIRNLGGQNLTGLAVTFSGSDASLLRLVKAPDKTITPSGSTTFTISFTPVNRGVKNALVNIASNDADENPFILAVMGQVGPEITVRRNGPPSVALDDIGRVEVFSTPAAAVPTQPLGSNTNPQFFQVLPERLVRLTALARPGYLFSHWAVTPVNATVSGATLTFTMTTQDMEAEAVFVENALLSATGAGNIFAGLVKPQPGTPVSNATYGHVTATAVLATGALSGRVTINGVSEPFSGVMMGGGAVLFQPGNTPSMAFNRGASRLTLSMSGGGIQAEVRSNGGAHVSSGTLARAKYSDSNPLPSELLNDKFPASAVANNRAYLTVALPAKAQTPARATNSYPQGDGYATLVMSTEGLVTLVGLLADGTAITTSSVVVEGNTMPIFVRLRAPGTTVDNGLTLSASSFSGSLQLDTTAADSDVTGTDLTWFRPTVVKRTRGSQSEISATLRYTAGWPGGIVVDAVGALYDRRVSVQDGLGLGGADLVNGNAEIVLTQGKLSSTVRITQLNIVGNLVQKIPAVNQNFSLVPVASTGFFSGTFTPNWTNPNVRVKPIYNGILLQKGASKGGYGFFLSNRLQNDLDPEIGRVTLGSP